MPPPRLAPEALDPDYHPYLGLHGSRGAHHPLRGPCFICEGSYLVEEALKAARDGALSVISVLTSDRRAGAWQARIPPGVRLLSVEDTFLESLLGFQFHRGVLCCVQRPSTPGEACALEAGSLLVLPRLDNVDNLGQLLRSAAGLGVDAVALGRGPDPFERRTVRVSMGAAWRIPVLSPPDLPALVARWKAQAPESEVVGAVLAAEAVPFPLWTPAPRTALILGAEGEGLDPAWCARCDRLVTIPMTRGMDSLNVAAAGAILMSRLRAPA